MKTESSGLGKAAYLRVLVNLQVLASAVVEEHALEDEQTTGLHLGT